MQFKATKKDKKDLVFCEVVKMEDDSYKFRAVSQQQQRTISEAVVSRAVTWMDMWRRKLRILIRAKVILFPVPGTCTSGTVAAADQARGLALKQHKSVVPPVTSR